MNKGETLIPADVVEQMMDAERKQTEFYRKQFQGENSPPYVELSKEEYIGMLQIYHSYPFNNEFQPVKIDAKKSMKEYQMMPLEHLRNLSEKILTLCTRIVATITKKSKFKDTLITTALMYYNMFIRRQHVKMEKEVYKTFFVENNLFGE